MRLLGSVVLQTFPHSVAVSSRGYMSQHALQQSYILLLLSLRAYLDLQFRKSIPALQRCCLDYISNEPKCSALQSMRLLGQLFCSLSRSTASMRRGFHLDCSDSQIDSVDGGGEGRRMSSYMEQPASGYTNVPETLYNPVQLSSNSAAPIIPPLTAKEDIQAEVHFLFFFNRRFFQFNCGPMQSLYPGAQCHPIPVLFMSVHLEICHSSRIECVSCLLSEELYTKI